MQQINYFFASLSPFLGLLIGALLIRIAPEEQKPLQKYFVLLKKIMLLLAFAFLAFYYFGSWLYFIGLIGFFLFLLFLEYKVKDSSKKSITTYAVLGILFFLSSKNMNLFAIESSIVLLYGVATASLIHNKKEKIQKIFHYGIGFIATSSLLFIITTSHFLF